MNQTNTLLKVVSIIYIVLEAIAAVVLLAGSAMIGAAFGMGAESAGVGVGMGVLVLVVSAGGIVLGLVAGILGVKGYKHITACKVLGFIILAGSVLGALLNISLFDSALSIIITVAVTLILPVLYLVGAFKGLADA